MSKRKSGSGKKSQPAVESQSAEIDPIDHAIEGLPPGELLAEGKARRKPGKPAGKPPGKEGGGLTRDQIKQIGRWWLECVPQDEIADRLKVRLRAVQFHINTYFKPRWQAGIGERLEIEIAKIEHLEAVAWEQFHASKDPLTMKRMEKIISDKTDTPATQIKKIRQITGKNAEPSWLHVIQFCRDWFAKVGSLYGNTLAGKEAGGNTEPPIILEVVVGTREEAKQMMEFSDFAKRLEDARSRESE